MYYGVSKRSNVYNYYNNEIELLYCVFDRVWETLTLRYSTSFWSGSMKQLYEVYS